MQPIERYGLISFLFIVVSALAVYLWDAEPLPVDPVGEQVARGEAQNRSSRETDATRRADQLADQRAARSSDKPVRNASVPKGSGVGLAVGSAERPGQGSRAQGKAPKVTTASGLSGAPKAGAHPSVVGVQPQVPIGAGLPKVPQSKNNLPKFADLKDSTTAMTPSQLASQKAKNLALKEPPSGLPGGTLSGPTSPKSQVVQPKAKLASAKVDNDSRAAASSRAGTVWTVAAGETLGDISLKHYGSARYWNEILTANPNASEHRLQVNQKLVLPVIDAAPAKDRLVAAAVTEKGTRVALQSNGIAVAAGDTLSDIAQKHLGRASRWREIADLNPSVNPNALQVGMVLKLPQGAARLDTASTKLVASRSADSLAENRASYGRVR